MNDQSSEDEQDDKVSEEVLQRREVMGKLIKFCKTKIEKILNRKQEDPSHDNSEEGVAGAHSEDDEEENSFEQNMDDTIFSGNEKRANIFIDLNLLTKRGKMLPIILINR